MPTIILLDVSFSMCRPVYPPDNPAEGDDEVTAQPLLRKELAANAVCQLLDHLQHTNKLEYVALMIYSSQHEVGVGFTRDYAAIRKAVMHVGDYDKTCLLDALKGAVSYCKDEWGSSTPCHLVVVTDGSEGVGCNALLRAVLGHRAAASFPLAGLAPAPLDIICIAGNDDPALATSLPLYQRFVELNGQGGVHVPKDKLSAMSVTEMMKDVCKKHFFPYRGVLHCGSLSAAVTLAPPPQAYVSPRDGGGSLSPRQTVSDEIVVMGFLTIVDVSSPPAFSRHLLLPLTSKGESSANGIECITVGSDDESTPDEGKIASLCVLLHGGLKKEGMVALCQVAQNWYGVLYSWSDNKKKSNLLLSIFYPGTDVVPWLGKLSELGPASALSVNPYTTPDATPPFPVKTSEKRSYSQPCVVWVRAGGLQTDVQKILRHARKLLDKTNSFYKELNRVRRAALQYGFPALLRGIASVLEREAHCLPSNAQPEAAMQLQHACSSLRAAADNADDPVNFDHKCHANIQPLKTNYTSHE